MKIKLSKADARLLALDAQFRFHRETFTPDRQGTLDVIKHLGYVQVDSIFVVERAHHHIIWSRQQDYKNTFIDNLQEKPRQIFEYWTHAASYLPMEDFRFYLPRMRRVKKDGFEWFQRDKRVMRYVKDRIAAEGPLQAKDFKDIKRKAEAWWGWKPAKIALEHLFMEGTLMVVGRENFRKIYDLAERVLPPDTVTKIPTPLQSAEYLIQRAVRSMGIVSYKDIVYLRKDGVEKVKSLLERRVKSGVLQAVE
ncbi:MAG: winged helix-turn-helix domain-containing protein, partial [bacterium]|nr:winged helix-turn-helix domain-containing protein [bacterium]